MKDKYRQTQLRLILEVLAIRLREYLHTFAATGKTERSVKVVVSGPYTGKIVVADHIINRMDGRRAGKIPWDFDKILLEWIKAKKIGKSTKQGTVDFAKAIAWNIYHHGTKQQKKRSLQFFKIIKDWKENDVKLWASKLNIDLERDMIQLKKVS